MHGKVVSVYITSTHKREQIVASDLQKLVKIVIENNLHFREQLLWVSKTFLIRPIYYKLKITLYIMQFKLIDAQTEVGGGGYPSKIGTDLYQDMRVVHLGPPLTSELSRQHINFSC